MKRTQILVPLSLVLVGILILAAPAAAKSTKIPYDFYEVVCLGTPGIEWQAGNTQHIRGQVNQSILYNADADIIGSNTVVLNANINLTTGRQQFFGTFSSILFDESPEGTFDGSWHGTAWPDGSFQGKAVGQGTGNNRGKKAKLDLNDPSTVPDPILAILFPDPPCEVFLGIFRDTGFVHKRGK